MEKYRYPEDIQKISVGVTWLGQANGNFTDVNAGRSHQGDFVINGLILIIKEKLDDLIGLRIRLGGIGWLH